METRKIGGVTVNNGNGLYDNEGMCDVLLESVNQLPKFLIDNQFIAFSRTISDIGVIIVNLKKAIASEKKINNEKVEMLKKTINELGGNLERIPIDNIKDGAE